MAFLLFAVVAAVTPGPSNIMLTAAGAQAGVVRGLPCLFVVPLGVGSVVLARPLALAALHWGGAAVLLWLAWKIATAEPRLESAPAREPVGYLGATVFQWVNPKSWLVTASAAGTFLTPDAASPGVQAAALAGLFVVAALPSGFVWLAFGALVQRALLNPRRVRIFNIAMGMLLAASIVLIVR